MHSLLESIENVSAREFVLKLAHMSEEMVKMEDSKAGLAQMASMIRFYALSLSKTPGLHVPPTYAADLCEYYTKVSGGLIWTFF
jgi:hypothetical protein